MIWLRYIALASIAIVLGGCEAIGFHDLPTEQVDAQYIRSESSFIDVNGNNVHYLIEGYRSCRQKSGPLAALDGAVEADYNESEPFPMLGFSGSWLLGKDWLIRGTAEAFSIDMNDTEGDFYNVRLECEHAFTESISVGAGYYLVRIDAEDTKQNNKVKYDYDGALIFLRWHL